MFSHYKPQTNKQMLVTFFPSLSPWTRLQSPSTSLRCDVYGRQWRWIATTIHLIITRTANGHHNMPPSSSTRMNGAQDACLEVSFLFISFFISLLTIPFLLRTHVQQSTNFYLQADNMYGQRQLWQIATAMDLIITRTTNGAIIINQDEQGLRRASWGKFLFYFLFFLLVH